MKTWDTTAHKYEIVIYNNQNYIIDTNKDSYSNIEAIPSKSNFYKWSTSGFVDQSTWLAGYILGPGADI